MKKMFSITLKFLEALRENNTTYWMHAHRDLYQQEKKRFESFVSDLLLEVKKLHPLREDLQIKECIFRLNKDLRYSRDQLPYKLNFWAVFAFGGKKLDFPCFYFHLEPWNSSFGGGIYRPRTKTAEQVRIHLLKNYDAWSALLDQPKFKKYYGPLHSSKSFKTTGKLKQIFQKDPTLVAQLSPSLQEIVLTQYAQIANRPELEHPEVEQILDHLAYFGDWLVDHPLKDQELMQENLPQQTLKAFTLLLPWLQFLELAYFEY